MSPRPASLLPVAVLGLVASIATAAAPPTPPGKDCYGDPLPPGALARLGTVRFRAFASVAAWAPDGRLLASASDDTIALWSATGRPVRQITSSWSIKSLAFSGSGKILASAGRALALWEVGTGKKLWQWGTGFQHNLFSVAFSPDGKLLATCGQDPFVRLYDAATGREIRALEGHDREWIVERVSFAPDGKTLASASRDRTVRIWDVATGKEVGKHQGKEAWSAVAHSPDGKLLALGDWKGNVILVDRSKGKEGRRIAAHGHPIGTLAFTPDGGTLVTGADYSTVRLWDAATGKERPGSSSIPKDCWHAACAPDGKFLALFGREKTIRLWDIHKGTERTTGGGHADMVEGVAVASDGKTVATAGWDGTIRLWDRASGRELRRWVAHGGEAVSAVLFLPGGKVLASAGYDGTARLWTAATGRQRKRFQLTEKPAFCLAPSGDGRRLFTAAWFLVEEWDVETGKRLRQLGKRPEDIEIGRVQPLSRLVVSPDGETVGVMQDGRLRWWNRGVERKADLAGLASCPTAPVAFSADGKTLAGPREGRDMPLSLWETATGQERIRLAWTPRGYSAAVVFGPRGSRLATADGADVHLGDATTGAHLHTFRGHQGSVSRLAFSPDGKALVSSSRDTTALVWDVSHLVPRKPALLAPANVNRLWTDLAGGDGGKAYRALWSLAGTPRLAVAFLAERLRVVAQPDARLVARRLAELDSDDFATRQKATADLAGWGETVAADLKRALAGKPSAEARRQLERLRKALRPDRPLPPEQLRALRALEVLEHAGTADAEKVLRRLARGAATARLTREAQAAVERLSRSAPPALKEQP